jgi:prefoldin alpha subunit
MAEDQQREMQEKVLVYQILQNQMEELSKQAALLEAKVNELGVTEAALDEIKGVKEGSETLVPLGAGVYGHGRLVEKDKVMVDVGAGIVAKKTINETLSVVRGRMEETEAVGKKLQGEIDKITEYMNQTLADIQKLGEEAKKPGSAKVGSKSG